MGEWYEKEKDILYYLNYPFFFNPYLFPSSFKPNGVF